MREWSCSDSFDAVSLSHSLSLILVHITVYVYSPLLCTSQQWKLQRTNNLHFHWPQSLSNTHTKNSQNWFHKKKKRKWNTRKQQKICCDFNRIWTIRNFSRLLWLPYRNRFSILLRHDLLRLNAIVRPRNEKKKKLNIDELDVFRIAPVCLCIQNNKTWLALRADIRVLSTFSSLPFYFWSRVCFVFITSCLLWPFEISLFFGMFRTFPDTFSHQFYEIHNENEQSGLVKVCRLVAFCLYHGFRQNYVVRVVFFFSFFNSFRLYHLSMRKITTTTTKSRRIKTPLIFSLVFVLRLFEIIWPRSHTTVFLLPFSVWDRTYDDRLRNRLNYTYCVWFFFCLHL